MSSRAVLVVFVVAITACATEDPQIVGVAAIAQSEVEIGPSTQDPIGEGAVSYRWDLTIRPDTSKVVAPEGGSSIRFVPDKRGVYEIDRWIVYGLSERLTHHFVLNTAGVAPIAVADGPAMSTVGGTATLDGTRSNSPEGLALRYRWRLVQRPAGSTASLTSIEGASSSIVPDVAGDFMIELAVFDGELWSAPDATLTVTAR